MAKTRRNKVKAGGAKKSRASAEVLDAEIVVDGEEPEAADDEFGDPYEAIKEEEEASSDELDLDSLDQATGKPNKNYLAPRGGTALAKRDPLSAYVQETRRYPLLTREEEHELAVRLQEHGEMDAARKLVQANLRLVVKIAYEYKRAYHNLLDLVQEGNLGLMQAVKKFDPYRGVKLSSYAAWWIRAYILKFVLNNWRLVKIGTTQAQRKLFFNLRKEQEKLQQLGFEPTTKLLAERLDVREKDVVDMHRRLAAPEASMDAPYGSQDEGTRSRYDVMAGTTASQPEVAVENKEFHDLLKEKLANFASGLEGREKKIFEERWLTEEPKTLQQIGDFYGVSRERARQIEKRMLGRLRIYLEAELGTAVDIDAMSRE